MFNECVFRYYKDSARQFWLFERWEQDAILDSMEGLDEVVRQWQYIRIDKKWTRMNKSYTYSASDLNPMFCARNILDSYRRNRIVQV